MSLENKTIACFYCKESLDPDFEINKDTTIIIQNYDPCKKCQEKMLSGITLIGASDKPIADDQLPIRIVKNKKYYPSGDWVVLRKEVLHNFFNNKETIDGLIETRGGIVSEDVVKNIILAIELAQEQIKKDNNESGE